MVFFSIDAYSSIWFWSLLIIAWSISIDKFSVHSHYQWISASNSGASQQKEILRSFYLKAEYQGKYKNNSLTFLLICFAFFKSSNEAKYLEPGLTFKYKLGTVSILWLKTSGFASKTLL